MCILMHKVSVLSRNSQRIASTVTKAPKSKEFKAFPRFFPSARKPSSQSATTSLPVELCSNGEAADVPPDERRAARADPRHAAPQSEEEDADAATGDAGRATNATTVPRRHHDAQEHHCDDWTDAGRPIAAVEWTQATEHHRDVCTADHDHDHDGERACCCEANSVYANHNSSKDNRAYAINRTTRACTSASRTTNGSTSRTDRRTCCTSPTGSKIIGSTACYANEPAAA